MTKRMGWTSPTVKLPPVGEPVLIVWVRYHVADYAIAELATSGVWIEVNQSWPYRKPPDYWMFLPSVPEEKET